MARSKGPVLGSTILDSLLGMGEEPLNAALPSFSKVYNLSVGDILAKMAERKAEKATETLLKGVTIKATTLTGGVPSEVLDILRDDNTKRLVFTLKYENDSFVLNVNVQSARGRKASDDSD